LLQAQCLPRPRHHLDAAREIAHAAEQRVHFLPPRDPAPGIAPVLQAVGIASRRAAPASCPYAQLNLMFREGAPLPSNFRLTTYPLMRQSQNPNSLIFVFTAQRNLTSRPSSLARVSGQHARETWEARPAGSRDQMFTFCFNPADAVRSAIIGIEVP